MAAPASGDDAPSVVRYDDSGSETDTEEYYNRHSPTEPDEAAAVTSRRRVGSVVVPANNAAAPSSVALTPPGRWRWGGTGKRGRSAGSGSVATSAVVSASPITEPADHQSTMAVLVAAAAPKPAVLHPVPSPALAPPTSSIPSSSVPTASATPTGTKRSGESSAQSVVHNDDAVETMPVATTAASASLAAAATAAVHRQQHPVAPPQPGPRRAAAAGRQNPGGYTCGRCGRWFATHQGLGGHVVGHNKHRDRDRDKDLLLLAAVPGGRRREGDAGKRKRAHVCGECGAEFATGVQLGGHKRKHWAGAPIVPCNKKPRPAAAAAAAPPEMAVETALETAAGPSSPVATGVRLFGVDIAPRRRCR